MSYGLNRTEFESLNFESHWRSNDNNDHTLPYTFTLEKGLQKPTIYFKKPMLFELVGASFTKKHGSKVCFNYLYFKKN